MADGKWKMADDAWAGRTILRFVSSFLVIQGGPSDATDLLSAPLRAAVCHWPGRRSDSPQCHHRPHWHRADAQCGKPQLHSVLALRCAPAGAYRGDVRDLLDCGRRRRGCRRAGTDHLDLPSPPDDQSEPDRFAEGLRWIGLFNISG